MCWLELNVMQETIYKNEVVVRSSFILVCSYVGHHKPPVVLSPRMFDVLRIDLDSSVVRMLKQLGICARPAANVQHTPDLAEIVVRQQRRQLIHHEWRLPQAVHHRLFQKIVAEAHCLHRTSNFPTVCANGNLSSATF